MSRPNARVRKTKLAEHDSRDDMARAGAKWSELKSRTHVAEGWAAELEGDTPVKNPALYKSTVQIFLQAGAEIVRPSSAAGVKLCREIVPASCSVWGAVKPCGKILKLQEISESELGRHYEERVGELTGAGSAAVLIQSMTDLDEAVMALRAAKKVCKLPVGVSMTFGSGPDQTDTVLGFSCEDAVVRLTDEGADLVGCDDGIAIDEMVLIVRLFREHTDLPILACPEAAQKELDGDKIVRKETPQEFAAKIGSLVTAGANVIGGGAGVGPDHIKMAVEVLKQ